MGSWDPAPILPVLAVAALGAALVAWFPRWCRSAPWRRVLLGVALVAVVWGLALALVRGPSSLERAMANQNEYVAVVHRVEAIGLGRFVETFTDPEILGRYPIHVEGHPIGATLVFVGLDRVGLGGAGAATAFLLAASAITAPAVLVAARAVADEAAARRAAPFLVLAPAAIWTVTSADALFAAVGAVAVAAVVVAACRARAGWAPASALAGGALFGVGVELSYGLVPLALVPAVVAVARRRWDVLALAAVGGGAVVGAAGLAGFWWLDGLGGHPGPLRGGHRLRAVVPLLRPAREPGRVRPGGGPGHRGGPGGGRVGLAAVPRRRSPPGPARAERAGGGDGGEPLRPVQGRGGADLAAVRPLGRAGRRLAAGAGGGGSAPWLAPASVLLAAQVAVAVAVESLVLTPW